MLFQALHLLTASVSFGGEDGDSDWRLIGLVFLLAGFVFYSVIYARYRNTSRRHMHETETKATTANQKSTDRYVRERKRLKSSQMQGANHTLVRAVRNRGTNPAGMLPQNLQDKWLK